eukprot:535725-Prymnesium_polylepis.2
MPHSAAAHAVHGSACWRGGPAAHTSRCCTQLKLAPPLAASIGAAGLPLAHHVAALGCSSRRP